MNGQLRVASWSLEATEVEVNALAKRLSSDERERAEAFVNATLRRRFVVARARLRERLAESLGVSPEALTFRYGPAGKPELVNDPSLHFNLTHSGELAACAIAPHPVGVDLEQIRPRKSYHSLAQRWFHPAEVERIDAAGDPLGEFYRTWTMKEAALKLLGVGVGESLPKVLTPSKQAGGEATGLPASALGLTSCRVTPIEIDPAYSAALATPPGSADSSAR